MITEYPRPGVAAAGGVQVSVQRLVQALEVVGVEITVIAPDTAVSREQWISKRGHRVVLVPSEARLSLLRGLRTWRKNVRIILRDVRPDIVHGQGVVVAGLAAADAVDAPRVLTAHGNVKADTRAAYKGVSGMARAVLRDRFARYVVERVEAVVSSHPSWRVNLPVEPRNFFYIPNIVDDHFFATERQAASGIVLFVGGPRAIKGWAVLEAAWPAVKAAVPHARLVATGWPDELFPVALDPTIEDSVSFEAALPPNELARLMAEASVLVIPSLFEVAPVSLAEAWAAGLPVVASAVGGIPDLARGAAVLVPARSPSKLADGLIRVLGRQTETEDFVAEGRRRVQSHSRAAVVADHVSLYSELLREHE